jgi:hypothetical protein
MATTSQHGTLTANSVTTVTLTGSHRGFRIQHRGAVDNPAIWWTWGYDTAPTPAVDGSTDGSYNLAGGAVDQVDGPHDTPPIGGRVIPGATTLTVKLISTGAEPFSVEAW